MTDAIEETHQNTHPAENGHWAWLYRLFIQPRRIFKNLAELETRAYFKPLLILSVLVVLLSLMGGQARLRDSQMNMGQPPEDFQYWSEKQQNQFFEGQAAMQGPLFIYVFPLLGSLAGLWAGWFLLSSILYLLMTFQGSRKAQVAYFNLVAWAALPFALRSLVQLIAVLTTQQVISDPGLSGFVNPGESSGLAYLHILLSFIDLYTLWFIALLIIGTPLVSELKSGKSLAMVTLAGLIFILLASLPEFIANKLGGLGNIRPFLFF